MAMDSMFILGWETLKGINYTLIKSNYCILWTFYLFMFILFTFWLKEKKVQMLQRPAEVTLGHFIYFTRQLLWRDIWCLLLGIPNMEETTERAVALVLVDLSIGYSPSPQPWPPQISTAPGAINDLNPICCPVPWSCLFLPHTSPDLLILSPSLVAVSSLYWHHFRSGLECSTGHFVINEHRLSCLRVNSPHPAQMHRKQFTYKRFWQEFVALRMLTNMD